MFICESFLTLEMDKRQQKNNKNRLQKSIYFICTIYSTNFPLWYFQASPLVTCFYAITCPCHTPFFLEWAVKPLFWLSVHTWLSVTACYNTSRVSLLASARFAMETYHFFSASYYLPTYIHFLSVVFGEGSKRMHRMTKTDSFTWN